MTKVITTGDLVTLLNTEDSLMVVFNEELIADSANKSLGIRYLRQDEDYRIGDECRHSYTSFCSGLCSSYHSNEPTEQEGTACFNLPDYLEFPRYEDFYSAVKCIIDETSYFSADHYVIIKGYFEGEDDTRQGQLLSCSDVVGYIFRIGEEEE